MLVQDVDSFCRYLHDSIETRFLGVETRGSDAGPKPGIDPLEFARSGH